MSDSTSVKILFVCYANLCRSPMAMAVLRHHLRAAGLSETISVKSAGTEGQYAGSAYHEKTLRACAAHDVEISGTSTAVTAELVQEADYIVAMDEGNLAALREAFPEEEGKFSLLGSYCVYRHPPRGEITDPVGAPMDAFFDCFLLIYDACSGLLQHIRSAHSL